MEGGNAGIVLVTRMLRSRVMQDAYMDVSGTRPWKVEGRTMQEAIVENDSGDKVEQLPRNDCSAPTQIMGL